MARFHITKKGEPGACYAKYSCPLGSSDEHFDTKEDAAKAFEEKMTSQLVPDGVAKDDLGLKELNELAKFSSDKDVLLSAIERGSDRTLANLAKNANMDENLLLEARNHATKPATKLALEKHSKFPADEISAENFADVYYEPKNSYDRRTELMESDSITDAHLQTMLDNLKEKPGIYMQSNMGPALSNPNNKLSQEMVEELAERNSIGMGNAMKSNRYPADKIKDLPKELVYWANVDNTESASYLHGYAEWAAQRAATYPHEAEYLATRIAANFHTSPASLQTLVDNGLALREVYKHPRALDSTKQMAVNISGEVARMAKIEELDKKYPKGLKNELLVADRTNQPYANRGIYDSSVLLDVDKVKALGLSREDVYTLMDARQYNGSVSYNEETGVFRATLDSTD